jgi:ribosomal protein S18 acetylase RimI-like enzyme
MDTARRLADPDRDGTVFMRDLTGMVDAPSSPPGLTLRAARPEDAAALQEAMEASGLYSADTVVTRLRHERRPYVGEADGMIVSYGWIALTPEPVGDLGFSFEVAPGEAYIYDCATRPDYRGRGYYPALLRAILADLHRSGYRRAWIATAPGNVPSQRGIVRAGFTKVADVHVTTYPDRSADVNVYGVPGIPLDILEQAAWSFHGRPHPNMGIPVV